ncbi:MAG: acyltransferase [Chloroflexi bacterium]|nr:acyltransferase [Chloroflexota bacterium]
MAREGAAAPPGHGLKERLYRFATRGDEADGAGGGTAVQVSLGELLYYFYQRGAFPLLRGLVYRCRLRAHGRRFFLGRGTRILYPRYLSVGDNVAIGDHVYLSCLSRDGVQLGDNVRVREYTWAQATSQLTNVGMGITVGANTYIGPHCVLGGGGGLVIGRDVTIGAYVDLLAENHAFADADRPINRQGVTRKGIVVEDDCWIGNRVIILDGVRVGRGSVIGAGAVVTRDVPPSAVAVGNPARAVRSRR